MPKRTVVLVSPIAPSDRYNGLAMRAGMFVDALADVADVVVITLPLAGTIGTDDWVRARARVVDPNDVDGLDHADAVLAIRGYTVPFALPLAERLGASRVVVDLDDDDERLMVELGHPEQAARAAALTRTILRDVDAVSLASPFDAGRVAARHALTNVVTIPNTVPVIDQPTPPPAGTARVLYLGNLTYAPNVEAARVLVEEVLPSLRRVRPDATVDLVGNYDEALDHFARVDGVTLAGLVPDVAPWYARADVVVVPLHSASGTRIKVLEAFSHRRPVVATSAAVSGLTVQDGVDVLVADTADDLAAAAGSVLADPELRDRLTAGGLATLADKYAPAVVAPLILDAVLGRTL